MAHRAGRTAVLEYFVPENVSQKKRSHTPLPSNPGFLKLGYGRHGSFRLVGPSKRKRKKTKENGPRLFAEGEGEGEGEAASETT